MKNTKKGTALVFAAACLFALGGLCVKVVPWNPMAINGARCLISSGVLGLFILATGHKIHITRGVLVGAGCIVVTTCLYATANKLTTAANAILLQFTAPIFVILIMWLLFRERPGRRDVVACIIVFAGVACFFLDGLGTGRMAGNLIALCSGVTYAGIFMMNKGPGADPLAASFLGHLAAGVIGLPFLVRETDFQPRTLLAVAVLGLFQMGLAYICLSLGLREASPVTASLTTGIEPILNPLLVALVLHESISPLAAVGGAVVLITVLGYNALEARAAAREALAAPGEEIPTGVG